MTEGQSVTAAAARGQEAGSGTPAAPGLAAPAGADHRIAPPPPARSSAATPRVPTIPRGGTGSRGSTGSGDSPGSRGSAGARGSTGPPAEPSVRVNAKLIESAILALRKPIVAAQLPLEAPGVEEARAERRKLLSQIDDYLLPRLRESGAPVLVALVGSTGAGKSTLVNSIVGVQVSMTGIRAPDDQQPGARLPPRRRRLVRGERLPAHRAPGAPGGAGPVGPGRAARARGERGHAQGRRPAGHARHRLGGARRTASSRTSSSTPPTCGCS